MAFSPEEIATKEFITSLRGYDTDEVRAFLKVIADDYRRVLHGVVEAEVEAASDTGLELKELLDQARADAERLKAETEKERRAVLAAAAKEAADLRAEASDTLEAAGRKAERLSADMSRVRDELLDTFDRLAEQIERARERVEGLTVAPPDPSFSEE
jgi:DivIVA domain-containing protein